MSKEGTLLTCIMVLLSFAYLAGADSTKVNQTPVAPKKLHSQELCPIMGEKINKKFFADVQGQRVYFCCAKCDDKFKANSDSLFKKAAADGVLFENIQKVCPISGDTYDKKIFTDWEGRRVFFCCRKCRTLFAADPMKYLRRFDMPADSVKWDKDVM